jgi:DNA phosphorothioation-dependent restriction protein DptG
MFRDEETTIDEMALSAAMAEIERLRKVLAWYADADNWRNDSVDAGHGYEEIPDTSSAMFDQGEHARKALGGAK